MKKSISFITNISIKKNNQNKKNNKINYKEKRNNVNINKKKAYYKNINTMNEESKYKNINDHFFNNKLKYKVAKSNSLYISKSMNNLEIENKNYKSQNEKNEKIIRESENINIQSYIENKNPKNTNRYLTYFENNTSIINDENKMNNLLSDFNIQNDYNNKENNNIKSNEKLKENQTNFIIKVNKKKPIQTKKFYVQACLDKKENNKRNNFEIKKENLPKRVQVLKLKKKNTERNSSNFFMNSKIFRKNYISCDEENKSNNKARTNGHSLKKQYKSFRLNEKKLFSNNNTKNSRNKIIAYNSIYKKRNKFKNKSCFEKEEKRQNNIKILNKLNSVSNYENKEYQSYKYKSSNPIKLNLKFQNSNRYLNHKIEIINNFKINSEKSEDMINSLSIKKNKINNNNKNNINIHINNNFYKNNFSLDISLNNKTHRNESAQIIEDKNNKNLLSFQKGEIYNKKKFSSVSREKYTRKIYKNNTASSLLDFDELNKKLTKMIRNIESKEKELRKNNTSRKNEEGFIKWDAFEKIIAEDD